MVSVTGLAFVVYNWVADKGFIGIVRVAKDETGTVHVQKHLDVDEGLYESVMNYADMIRGDRKSTEAKQRYREMYAVDAEEPSKDGQ